MADIALTQAQRSNIATLRDIQSLTDRTQERLSTGRKVNSVIDDAAAYFTSKALTDRASDFLNKKDSIDQGISALQASLQATESVSDLLAQMKGIVQAAKLQTTSERVSSTEQFNEVGKQIFQLIEDASYNGNNLINNTANTLTVRFSERSASRIEIGGFNLNDTAGTKGIFTAATFFTAGGAVKFSALDGVTIAGLTLIGANNSFIQEAEDAVAAIEDAIINLRGKASEIGSNISLLQTRSDFTQSYANELEGGADKLTLADINEEGANLTALQTRQQISIQALAVSGDNQRSVLVLLQ